MKAELLLSLILLAAPAAARTRAPKVVPDGAALIARALTPPATAFVAAGRVQSFPAGGRPKSLGLTLIAGADGTVLKELRKSPRKPFVLAFADDGRTRTAYWPRRNAVWTGKSAAADWSGVYEVAVTTGGHVAKRATWRVNLSLGGRVRRSIWVDRDAGLPLKNEIYRRDGTIARRERLTKLDFAAGAPAEAFPAAAKRDDISYGAGVSWVPDGFLPVGASKANGVTTVRYGDGTAEFTVTVSGKSGPCKVDADAPEGAASCGGIAVSGSLAPDEALRVARSAP